MNVDQLFTLINAERLAVFSTVFPDGRPQSAIMGFAVTPHLELVFDTVKSSRKYPNLKHDPRMAVVINVGPEVTIQYEGLAEELSGESRDKYLKVYFEKWPDGPERLAWNGIVHFVVRPKWLRYSDFNNATYAIEEFTF
jgi:general stress protein 26